MTKSPTIHGLISREHGMSMLPPMGERIIDELDAQLLPGNISPLDAAQVTWGAPFKHALPIYARVGADDSMSTTQRLDRVRKAWEFGVDSSLESMVLASNDEQTRHVIKLRGDSLKGNTGYANTLCSAIGTLANTGFLESIDADAFRHNLLSATGNPRLQYTPVTQLEFVRLLRKYDGEDPHPSVSDLTDFSLGVILSSTRLKPSHIRNNVHSKPHEFVHAGQGVEMYDITRDDGRRMPIATVNGLFATEPTTEISPDNDRSKIKNEFINEAWTDLISQEAMLVDPSLGSALPEKNNSYSELVDTMRMLKGAYPQLFCALTKAVFVEASLGYPDAKRDAIWDLHQRADHAFKRLNSLDRLFNN